MSGIGFGRRDPTYRAASDPTEELQTENARLKDELKRAHMVITGVVGMALVGVALGMFDHLSEQIQTRTSTSIARTPRGDVTIITSSAEFDQLPRSPSSYTTTWRGLLCVAYCDPGWRGIADCSNTRLVCYLPPQPICR